MSTSEDLNAAALAEIAQVRGQLTNITQLILNGQAATNTRIEDLRRTFEGRFDGVEKRLSTIEQNERGTAMRTSAIGAVSGAIVAAAIAALRHIP